MATSPERFALFIFCLASLLFAQKSTRSLYFLAGDDGQLCGYSSVKLWNDDKISLEARLVARADYENGRLAFVYITELDETGDWTIFDKYSFDKNALLTSLERTIDILPGERREEQLWVIEKGKAVKQKSTSRDLATSKIVPRGDVWLPEPAVVTNTQALPFWPLIRDKRAEILSREKVCMTDQSRAH